MSTKTGKGKYGDRRSVMAYQIDHDKLREARHRYVKAVYGLDVDSTETRDKISDDTWVALRVTDDGSLPERDWVEPGDSPRSTWALICTEGVGYCADDYNVFNLPVFGASLSATRFQFYIGLLDDMLLDEQVDLADHVRVFGDRLENNFSIWAEKAALEEVTA